VTVTTVAEKVVEDFVQHVDTARSWRKKELSELVQALQGTVAGSQLNESLRRALALLLNAHWEALAKDAIDSYLRAAKVIGVQEALSEGIPFMALAMESSYATAVKLEKKRIEGKDKDKGPVLHPLADVLMRGEYYVGHLWTEMPDMVSNRVGLSLWWDRFVYLCDLVDVPVPHAAADSQIINERVVKIRHEIAHGKQTLPDEADLLEARERVMALIDALADALQDSLEHRRFAR
jgi:hypothetical protein